MVREFWFKNEYTGEIYVITSISANYAYKVIRKYKVTDRRCKTKNLNDKIKFWKVTAAER